MRSKCDLSRSSSNRFTGREPSALIDDHPAWHTFIGDDLERDAFAVSVEAILSRAIATAWSTAHRELNYVTFSFPATVELGPAIAFERERTPRIEARCKHTERQRMRR